jgi:2-oxoglutarate dehydrogenase E2 component (dihydrolipoamide succinyltransferase)
MSIEIKVPALGESVTEATVAKWLKEAGDAVKADEPLVELETDKVSLEVNAPASGTLAAIEALAGAEVAVGAVLGRIEEGAAPAEAKEKPKPAAKEEAKAEPEAAAAEAEPEPAAAEAKGGPALSPSVRKLIDEHGIDPSTIEATGPKSNITKEDVQQAIAAQEKPAEPAPAAKAKPEAAKPEAAKPEATPAAAPAPAGREERVRMTRLRRRIAERLKEAQNTAAMLTTFNECDMSKVMALRARHQDAFVKAHGVKLGFMSFFVKACIEALQAFPAVNAEIDGEEIVYKRYYHIGVAVSTESGLVVPVLRDADRLGFAEIEKRIGELGLRARDGKLAMDDLMGGTFTISNGGIFGSLLSTPILNPPQSGILGMHKIQERPVVEKGQVVVRPMMYLALSYDHRLIDGREAVTFLVKVKEGIEDPERMLLGV